MRGVKCVELDAQNLLKCLYTAVLGVGRCVSISKKDTLRRLLAFVVRVLHIHEHTGRFLTLRHQVRSRSCRTALRCQHARAFPTTYSTPSQFRSVYMQLHPFTSTHAKGARQLAHASGACRGTAALLLAELQSGALRVASLDPASRTCRAATLRV